MGIVFGRSAWNALPPHWVASPIDTVDAFVLHHAAGAQPTSYDESIAMWQQYQRQHLHTWTCRGYGHQFIDYGNPTRCPTHPSVAVSPTYADLAYNIGAGWNCALVGRGVTLSDGATDGDPTTRTWSICVLGDYTKDLVTTEIRAGILTALQIGCDLWGTQPLRPHRDYYPTACPGDNLVAAIPSLETGADMTPLEYFAHPITLTEEPGAKPYPTTIEGWHIYTHREMQLMRIALEKLAGEP